MIGWLVVGTYLIGLVFAWRRLARGVLNTMVGDYYIEPFDRVMAIGFAFLLALVWPLIVAFLGIKRLVFPGGLRSDREIRADLERQMEEQAAELRKLRARARELDLPFPEVRP